MGFDPRAFLADSADNVGTFLGLPDWGWSEGANGGRATVNTGRVGFTENSLMNTPSSPSKDLVNRYNQQQSPGVDRKTIYQNSDVGGALDVQRTANDTGLYGTGGGAGAPTSDAATAAYYQDMINQLNGQQGRLDGQLNTGLSNLQNSYNTQANRLGENKAVAERNYNTQNQQNMQGYSNSRTGIMNNTRSTANALQRLLGLNGAGNSSAALEQAPYAAGLQGSQNLNEAQQNYSTNTVRLKTAKEDADRGFKNAYQDLDTQKFQQENGLRSQIAQTRAGLLDKIAEAGTQRQMALGQNYEQARAARTPYQQQINSLLDQITGLGNQYANPVLKAQDVAYKQAELGDFSLGDQAQIANQAGGGGNLDPTFLNMLTAPRNKDRERNNLLGL